LYHTQVLWRSWGSSKDSSRLAPARGVHLFVTLLPGSWSGMAALEDLQLSVNALTGCEGGSQGRGGSVWPSCGSRQAQCALVGCHPTQWEGGGGGTRVGIGLPEPHPAIDIEEWGSHMTQPLRVAAVLLCCPVF
jgi:hypothetical protein